MKINPIIILALSIVLLSLFSCKKNDASPPDFSTKVKIYIEDQTNTPLQSSDTFNIAYDANDRLVSVISTFSGSKFLFHYNSNVSYTMDIMSGNHLIIRETSFINSDQLVDSSFQYNVSHRASTYCRR